jgi:hypothetical protein
MAISGETYSTEATPGSTATSATSVSISSWVSSSTRRAVTPTLLSMYARPELSPPSTMTSPDRRTSMRMTVAVAARLIIRLRQKPWPARTRVNPRNLRKPMSGAS